ncbi:putative chromosomal replication initiator, DnaA [Roseibium sp. TrichSKD4]|nr:putative chromosomal replication initiator, DnaA [Roseibium sp. TrichSKD4]
MTMTAFFPRPPAELLPEFARLTGYTGDPIEVDERDDLDLMMLYLEKARARAIKIRDNATAGSYLDRVLQRTIDGLDTEVAQLKYLLAERDLPLPTRTKLASENRMRPAL